MLQLSVLPQATLQAFKQCLHPSTVQYSTTYNGHAATVTEQHCTQAQLSVLANCEVLRNLSKLQLGELMQDTKNTDLLRLLARRQRHAV